MQLIKIAWHTGYKAYITGYRECPHWITTGLRSNAFRFFGQSAKPIARIIREEIRGVANVNVEEA